MPGEDGVKERRSLWVLLAEYMANTSAHGLPNIDRGRNSYRKAVWSLLFMWALGMFIWQCYELINSYFLWGVDVSIDIQYETQLDFPAVTICNLNPIKSSATKYDDRINRLFGSDDGSTVTVETTTDTSFSGTIKYIPESVNEAVHVSSDQGLQGVTAVNGGDTVSDLTAPSFESAISTAKSIEGFPATIASNSITNSAQNHAVTPETKTGMPQNQELQTMTSSLENGSNLPITEMVQTEFSTVLPEKETSAVVETATPGSIPGGSANPSAEGKQPQMPGKKRRRRDTSRYQDWSNVDFMAKNEELDLFDQIIDAVSLADYEERVNFGHQIEDMVLLCTFKGYPCSPSNFTYFHNYLYGNCYTFNSGIDSDISKTSKSGPLYGLTLELNIEETEYQPSIQEASGIRVLVSEQYKMPFPEDAGINVAPGLLTSVGLRKLGIIREKDPYSTCQQSSNANDTIFSSFFNVGYSLEACQKHCLYRMIQDRCDCDDTRFRFFPDLDPCLSTNASQVLCKETVELQYANEEFECSCTSPCQESSFEMTVSSAAWPNTVYASQVRQDLLDISDDFNTKVSNDPNFVQNNVLKLQVYYEQLNYEMVLQTPKYNFFSLISNLGGQVGLWIGISMCTVFEVVELVFDILKLLLLKLVTLSHAKKATAPSFVDIELEKKKKSQLHDSDYYLDTGNDGKEKARARTTSTTWIN